MTQATDASGLTKYTGSCHCGKNRWEVEMDLASGVGRCNCTICTKLGVTSMIVKPAAFRLLAGDDLTTYPNRIGARFFCKHCGVYAYGNGHLPEVGGDFVSVNLNAIDRLDPRDLKVSYWDGRHDNWQAGPRKTPWPIETAAP
jgi:hypothetical protein